MSTTMDIIMRNQMLCNQVAVYIPFIKAFVCDKGGRCLKSEIIREIFEYESNLKQSCCFTSPCTGQVRAMLDYFENECLYGSNLIFKKSKLSDRIIYNYIYDRLPKYNLG